MIGVESQVEVILVAARRASFNSWLMALNRDERNAAWRAWSSLANAIKYNRGVAYLPTGCTMAEE